MAEEVGVEPTSRLISSSTALKAAHPTGGDALPLIILPDKASYTILVRDPHGTMITFIQIFELTALRDGTKQE